MGDKLTPEELAEFREIFNLVDKDGGGTISKEELGELMETLGIDATPEEIDLMIAEIDEDNNGVIDFDEFVDMFCMSSAFKLPSLDVMRKVCNEL